MVKESISVAEKLEAGLVGEVIVGILGCGGGLNFHAVQFSDHRLTLAGRHFDAGLAARSMSRKAFVASRLWKTMSCQRCRSRSSLLSSSSWW